MLSKSRFVTGCQCHKLLWWTVHDPNAKELEPDKVLRDLFDQGRQVGELARTRYPGGVLIDLPHQAREERVAATEAALESDVPAVFEGTFIARDTYVAIDVLEKRGAGHHLVEVKASNSQKPEHIPDVAVQAYIAAASGVVVNSAEVMHLNKEFRHPDGGDLFARTDVTEAVAEFLPNVPDELARQEEMLEGPLPDVPNGSYAHAEFLAEGPTDARPPLVKAMIEATTHADRIVTYSSFEKSRIREMQEAVPRLAAELAALEEKLIDLYPVMQKCVYHPGFNGSYSLKAILTPLVPELTYDDLVIVDGRVASVEIARLLFVAGKIPRHEHDRVRKDLLDYCERDTWAMVKLLEKLQELTSAA